MVNIPGTRTSSVFCPNCGKEVGPDDRYCRYCSFSLDDVRHDEDRSSTPDHTTANGERSALLAMLLSVVLPGTGALYMDSNPKGVLVLAFSIILLVLMLFVPPFIIPIMVVLLALWLYGLFITSVSIDRYREKNRFN